MGLELGSATIEPAPSRCAVVSREGSGTLSISLRTIPADWLGCAAGASLLPAGILGSLATVMLLHATAAPVTPGTDTATGVRVAVGLIAALLSTPFVFPVSAWLLAKSIRGSVRLEPEAVTLWDGAACYRFPRSEVRSFAVVRLGRKKLTFNPSLPMREAFRRGRVLALEVEVPEGRIRFFKMHGSGEVCWLARVLSAAWGVPLAERGAEAKEGGVATESLAGSRRDFRKLGVMIGAVAVLALGLTVPWIVHGWRSARWPTTTGVVTEVVGPGSPRRNRTTIVRYEYRVGGQTLTGDRLWFGDGGSEVDAFGRAHPVGTPVTVHYDPSKPSRATLIAHIDFGLWMFAGLGAALGVVAVGFFLQRADGAAEHLRGLYAVEEAASRRE